MSDYVSEGDESAFYAEFESDDERRSPAETAGSLPQFAGKPEQEGWQNPTDEGNTTDEDEADNREMFYGQADSIYGATDNMSSSWYDTDATDPSLTEYPGEEEDEPAENSNQNQQGSVASGVQASGSNLNVRQAGEQQHSGTTQPPKGITPEEFTILSNAKPRWLSCKGEARKKLLIALHGEMENLDILQGLDEKTWTARKIVYKNWLYNQCRTGVNRSHIRVGRTWTARSVLQELNKDKIAEIIRDHYKVTPGTKQALPLYQRAMRRFMKKCSEARKQAAERTAAEWNLSRGPPPDVQARNARRWGERVAREFAQEMWRACGMRIVMLAAWKNEKSEILSGAIDFNDEFGAGCKFDGIDQARDTWEEYIQGVFAEKSSDTDTEVAEREDVRVVAAGKRQRRADPTLNVMKNSTIWIDDWLHLKRDGRQALVRGFMTAHYRKACGKPRGPAPWKGMSTRLREMVADRHLPDTFSLPGDPSHLRNKDLGEFLQFIHARQQTNPDDVFAFHHWIDDDGTLHPAVQDGDIADNEEEGSDDDGMESVGRRGKGKHRRRKGGKQSKTKTERKELETSDSDDDAFTVDIEGSDEDEARWTITPVARISQSSDGYTLNKPARKEPVSTADSTNQNGSTYRPRSRQQTKSAQGSKIAPCISRPAERREVLESHGVQRGDDTPNTESSGKKQAECGPSMRELKASAGGSNAPSRNRDWVYTEIVPVNMGSGDEENDSVADQSRPDREINGIDPTQARSYQNSINASTSGHPSGSSKRPILKSAFRRAGTPYLQPRTSEIAQSSSPAKTQNKGKQKELGPPVVAKPLSGVAYIANPRDRWAHKVKTTVVALAPEISIGNNDIPYPAPEIARNASNSAQVPLDLQGAGRRPRDSSVAGGKRRLQDQAASANKSKYKQNRQVKGSETSDPVATDEVGANHQSDLCLPPSTPAVIETVGETQVCIGNASRSANVIVGNTDVIPNVQHKANTANIPSTPSRAGRDPKDDESFSLGGGRRSGCKTRRPTRPDDDFPTPLKKTPHKRKYPPSGVLPSKRFKQSAGQNSTPAT